MPLRLLLSGACALGAVLAVLPAAAQAPEAPPAPPPAASPAAAQAEPSSGDRETARQLWTLGRERLAAGDGAGALEAFSGAEKLVPAPTTTLAVAQAYLTLGKLIEARDALLRVLRYPAQAGEPAPFASAREEARRLSAETADRVPTVQIEVQTPKGPLGKEVPVRITVDDAVLEGALARLPRSVNPGKHEIRASAAGHGEGKVAVEVKERERKVVAVVLRPPAGKPIATPVPTPTTEAQPDTPEPEGAGTSPVAFVGLGIAAAGIVVGALTGGLAASATSDAEERCAGGVCGPDAREDLDRARVLGEISNAGFGAAIAGLGVGLTALFAPGSPPAQGEGGAPPPAAWVGFGIGGAGIATGIVTGVLALSATSSAEEACAGAPRCPEAAMQDASRSRTLAGISTAALAAGGVGAGLGLTALLLGPPSRGDGARLAPSVGPGEIGMRARF
jgi:hypothetical protein